MGRFRSGTKAIDFDKTTPEALVLKGVLEKVRPDFYYPLHNALAGGAFYFVTHDIGRDRYQGFDPLLERSGIPIQTNIYHSIFCDTFGDGVLKLPSLRNVYDLIEKSGAAPELLFRNGTTSAEYLADIKPSAQSLVGEMPYLTHPLSTSTEETDQNMRQLKLRLDADLKYVAVAIMEAWDKVESELDRSSPFYRKISAGLIAGRETVHEGVAAGPGTRDLLFNPTYSRNVTVAERFENYIIHLFFLSNLYAFVRLLKETAQTDEVTAAISRLDATFDAALRDIVANIDVDRLHFVEHRKLALAQLGSGFVVINAALEGAD
jgi:hypothetical protein